MNSLLIQAIKKAGQIRTKLKLNIVEPVNIFDVCETFGLDVRFVDVSMEGMYVNQTNSARQTIFLSSLRPFPRRVFTCAHEFGHHTFGHGSKVDGLVEDSGNSEEYDNDEYLVDSFAGAFLMPVAGIEAEFRKRNWELRSASPLDFFTISSVFGTGYRTLINHCKKNKLINDTQAINLSKLTPAKLLQQIMGSSVKKSHFKIIDGRTNVSVIDLEVGNYLFLPSGVNVEGSHLAKLYKTNYGDAFIAERSGIVRVSSEKQEQNFFVRIQNAGYVGLAKYRHLEVK